MRSRNLKPADLAHMGRVKELSCAVCGEAAPSDAHHIWPGLHYLTIPLCKSCHQCNHNGIHGARAMWKVMRKTEEIALNETIARLLSVA